MYRNGKVLIKAKNIHERVQDYYRGERISNALLAFVGGGGITWTLLLYLWRHGQLSTGLFYSTLPLGIFFLITGSYRFYRSIIRYRNASDEFSGIVFLKNNELNHLEERHDRFLKKRKVDIVGVLLGFSLITFSLIGSWNHLILGTALSLSVFSSLLLVFDLFGQFRTAELLHHLRKIKNG